MSAAGDFFFDNFGWFLLALIVVMLGGAIGASVWESKQPHIELLKTEWACTQSESITRTTFILVGKVLVPSTSTHIECVQWSRQP